MLDLVNSLVAIARQDFSIDEEQRFITVHPHGDESKGVAVPVDGHGIPSGNGTLATKLRARWNDCHVSKRRPIKELMPDVGNVVISTNLKGLKFGSTKDLRSIESHKVLREQGNLVAARSVAKAMAESDETKDAGLYLMAKYHKDDYAAEKLVSRVLKESAIRALSSKLDRSLPVVFVPLQNTEGEGNNRIPFAYATALSKLFDGSSVCTTVSKVSKEHNTGATTSDRLQRSFAFAGDPDFQNNSQVVIVDDNWTSGQTCVSMAEYLKRKMPGCKICGITTLAASRYGVDVVPSEERIAKVLAKGGISSEEEFKEITGVDIRTRTGSELQTYFLNGSKGVQGIVDRFGRSHQNNEGRG